MFLFGFKVKFMTMKLGFCKPPLKKRIAARTTSKPLTNCAFGLSVPRWTLFFLTASVFLSCSESNSDIQELNSSKIKSLTEILKSIETIEIVESDFNADGIVDRVILGNKKDSVKIDVEDDFYAVDSIFIKPKLLVVLLSKDKALGLYSYNDRIFSTDDDEFFGKEVSISSKDKKLFISYHNNPTGGGAFRFITEFTFRYQEGHLRLIGADWRTTNRMAPSTTITSLNLLTGKYYTEELTEWERENENIAEVSPKSWKKLKETKVYYIEDIERLSELDLGIEE